MASVTVPLKGELPVTADVITIGAGSSASAQSFVCAQAGLNTVVVEKREDLGRLITAASAECFRA